MKGSVWRLFAVAACPILGLALTLYWSWQQVTINRAAFSRSEAIEGNLQALGEDLLDAETGQRGYLLTLDARYLGPYLAAQVDAPKRLEALARVMVDPSARSDLGRIRPLVAATLAELTATVALATGGQQDQALRMAAEGSGMRLMEEFGATRDQTIGRERNLLERRYASVEREMSRLALIWCIAGAALIVALFWYARRTVAQLGPSSDHLANGSNSLATNDGGGRLGISTSDNIRRIGRAGAVAGIGRWEFDIREQALTWSDETKRLFGVVPSYRPTVEAALRFYKPEALPIIQKHFEACITTAEPSDLELEITTAEGISLWTLFTSAAEFEAGVAVRVVGAVQDITDRKTLERDLAESNELVRVTLDSIGDAVITTDMAGHVVWLNPVAERLTGWAKDEARAKPLNEVLKLTDTETGQPSLDPVISCIREGKSVGFPSHTTLRSRRGEDYGIEASASPIRNAAGQILGAVLVYHDVSEQRRLTVQMSHRATHDALTGLINRAEFEYRLSRLLEEATLDRRGHVLMYIDLDDFKVINDDCGHAAGDQLLRQVSMLLQGAIRGRDTVARLGGDEFGVILEMCNIEQGGEIAQKICGQMELYRYAHEGRRYRVGASIGVVPVDLCWQSSSAVLQAADGCCYAAKDAGGNCVRFWTESDNTVKARQGATQWLNRLEAAIDENRFVLFAQHILPVRGPAAGLHCEVLLRLREDDGSTILAGSFLPAAERFDLMARIDTWVLRNVLEMLAADAIGLDDIDTVAVNLSAQSMGDRAFQRDLIRMLQEAQADAGKLCFKITETAAITHFGDAKAFFEEVRSLGVRLALDDFGAGALSFGYLHMLPVDYLKIDRQYIIGLDDPLNSAAVRCFCEVANAVGAKTIADCGDRRDDRDTLDAMGVDLVQGLLIHHPEPLAAVLSSRLPAMSSRHSTPARSRRSG